MPIKALETIRHSGRIFNSGDIIQGLNSEDESRLLSLKAAEKFQSAEDVKNVITQTDVTPESFKELSASLDEAYGAEELKREAKAAGVKFEATAKKPEVIEAIIKQNKVDLLLEDEDGE